VPAADSANASFPGRLVVTSVAPGPWVLRRRRSGLQVVLPMQRSLARTGPTLAYSVPEYVEISPSVGSRLAAWAPVALALAFVAALTLVPVSHALSVDDIPFWCLGCGDYALADGVANVVLFVPLGWAMSGAGVRWSRGLAVILMITIGIESLQYGFIPGRVASIADILANTVGGAVGITIPHLRRWVSAPPERARRAAIVYALLLVGCLGVGVETQAILPSGTLYWTRGVADGLHYVPFNGSLRDVRVDDVPIPLDRWLTISRSAIGARDIGVALTSGRPDTGLAHVIIAWMPNGRGWMWLEQRDRDLHVHIASRSDPLRLHGHSFWLRNAMPAQAGEPVSIRLVVRPFGYRIALRTNAAGVVREARVSPGDGWRLFAPGQRGWGKWAGLWTAGWMAVLLVPLGYAASRASRATALATAVGAAVYLVVLPTGSGCAWLPVPGWCGAAAGLLIGCLGARPMPSGGATRANRAVGRQQESTERLA
jgi:VanZ like family